MQLQEIEGVGEQKARVLQANGYEYVEDVAVATLIHFDQLPNMSRDLIAEAQKLLEGNNDVGFRVDQPTINPEMINRYYCEYCGVNFDGNQAKMAVDPKYHDCEITAPR